MNKIPNKTGIIYRNYQNPLNIKEIINIKNYCKNRKIKFFLSNNIKLANKLSLDGAYIPSFNKNVRHLNYSFKSNFLIIGSAHNIKEIKIKEFQKVSIIFISSIFKDNKNFLGVNKFRNLIDKTKLKVIALGGVSKKNIKKLKLIKVYGFAGISYFEQKTGLLKRGLF